MSIEVNLNDVGIFHQNMCDKINEMLKKDKEDKIKIGYEMKIKRMKEKLTSLLKSTLGKNLLNLEAKTKEHIQILTSTTKRYNDFNKKIRLLKKQVEENRNATFTTFDAVKFTTQVVNGVMYKIKVKVGDDQYIHLRALKNLPHKGGNVVLKNVEEGTFKLADPLN